MLEARSGCSADARRDGGAHGTRCRAAGSEEESVIAVTAEGREHEVSKGARPAGATTEGRPARTCGGCRFDRAEVRPAESLSRSGWIAGGGRERREASVTYWRVRGASTRPLLRHWRHGDGARAAETEGRGRRGFAGRHFSPEMPRAWPEEVRRAQHCGHRSRCPGSALKDGSLDLVTRRFGLSQSREF